MFSMFFFISLYVQQVLDFSPVKTGLAFLPVPIVIGIVASNMSKLVGKIGYRIPMIVGPLFASVGLFYMSHIHIGGSYWTGVFPGLIIMGIGMGQIFISVTIAATTGVPQHESGLASGLLNTSQQIGGALGLAILTGVATAAAKSFVSAASHPTTAAAGHKLAVAAQVHGYHNALFVSAFFPLVTAAIALLFVRHFETDDDGMAIPA
jgi:MFS family permease